MPEQAGRLHDEREADHAEGVRGEQLRVAVSPSLIEAQRNFVAFGAKEGRFVGNVREPAPEEPIEIGWRPVVPTQDLIEAAFDDQPWPEDLTVLYYWRPAFLRRRTS